MKHLFTLLTALLLAPLATLTASADEPITWLAQYDAKSLPQEQGWQAVGALAAHAKLANSALRVVDDSAKESGAFRAAWKQKHADWQQLLKARLGNKTK